MEDPQQTLDALPDDVSVDVREVTASTIADGLVSTAVENGGVLVIDASRTRGLKRWILGSTPDLVIERASETGLPVIVYASETTVPGRIVDLLFPFYRFYRQTRTRNRPP